MFSVNLFCRRRKNVQQIYKAYYKVINGRDRGKNKTDNFFRRNASTIGETFSPLIFLSCKLRFVAFSPFFYYCFWSARVTNAKGKKSPYLPPPQNPNLEEKKRKKKRVELLNVLRDERLKKKKCKPYAVWCEPEIETSICFWGIRDLGLFHRRSSLIFSPFFFYGYATTKKSAKMLRAGTRKVCKLKGNVTGTRKKKDQTEVKEKMEDETEWTNYFRRKNTWLRCRNNLKLLQFIHKNPQIKNVINYAFCFGWKTSWWFFLVWIISQNAGKQKQRTYSHLQ